MQKWYLYFETNQVLNTSYKHIKTIFCLEHYLETIVCKSISKNICKIRISAHNLIIETGSYGRNRLQRSERLWHLCNLKSRMNIILFWYAHVITIFDEISKDIITQKLVQLLQLNN